MSIKGAGVMTRGRANFEGDLELARAKSLIFFDISNKLDSAVTSGRLAIYKYDEARDVWVRLPTPYC